MEQAAMAGGPSPLDESGLCMLSFDGGGVRGLSSLYILDHIMRNLNRGRELAGQPAKKPCEIFDLIGGTSTGG
jgi:patatin-like phospholipase/acyl hydrolase